MKTIFFPQSTIDPALAEVLPAGFGPLILVHPSREALAAPITALAEANRVELVFPCREDTVAPGETIEALKRWAAEHAGQDLAGLLRRTPDIPFFDADASARLAAEIKSGHSASTAATAAQRLQRARLLLVMAQELDRSQHELATGFQRLEAQERRMMADLKGEAEAPGFGEKGSGRRSPAVAAPLYMLPERLEAWAQLALAASDNWAQDPVVWFLTDNRGVLEHVSEQSEADTLLDRRLSIGAFETLKAWLADPQGPPPVPDSPGPSTSRSVQLTLMRFPDLPRNLWLRRLAGEASPQATATDQSVPDSDLRVACATLA